MAHRLAKPQIGGNAPADPRLFCTLPQEPERIVWQEKAAREMGVDAKAPFLAGRYIVHRPMLSSIPAPPMWLRP